jgi:hypothetical protein
LWDLGRWDADASQPGWIREDGHAGSALLLVLSEVPAHAARRAQQRQGWPNPARQHGVQSDSLCSFPSWKREIAAKGPTICEGNGRHGMTYSASLRSVSVVPGFSTWRCIRNAADVSSASSATCSLQPRLCCNPAGLSPAGNQGVRTRAAGVSVSSNCGDRAGGQRSGHVHSCSGSSASRGTRR